jgi:transmembrane sensor
MNKVIKIKDDNIDEEASLWISRLDRGLSESERLDLNNWLDLSARHNRAFRVQAECWEKTEVLSSLADLFPDPAKKSSAASVFLGWKVWAGAAGPLMLLILLWPGVFSPMENAKILNPQLLSYETAVGGLSRVVLTDGSTLILNTATKVNVRMTESFREITIARGEINVDVAHDPLRPLRVIANDSVFEAVGTKFNIRIDESQIIELLVTEGKVKVKVAPKSATDSLANLGVLTSNLVIAQGERVILEGGESEVETLVDADIEVELSWRQGNLIFRGEPLSEALGEISRYTSVEFVIVDENLRAIQVAGLFKAGDVAGFLASLEANFGIHYERKGNQTQLLAPTRTVIE